MKLKLLLTLITMQGCLAAHAQYIMHNGKQYMDTTTSLPAGCLHETLGYYYGLKCKYPMASETIASKANAYLKTKNTTFNTEGYITFRFSITCAGAIQYTELLETDSNYKPMQHEVQLVRALYDFIKTLNQWKTIKNDQNIASNYYSFITFKISNGRVTQVIP